MSSVLAKLSAVRDDSGRWLLAVRSTELIVYHLALSVLNVITTSRPFILPLVVFPILCSRPSTFRHAHCPSQHSDLFHFHWPPPLSRRHSALLRFPNFDSIISYFQNALQQISSWMTVNLLTLNSFNMTEFLLIRFKKQLAKIHNSSLDTFHFDRNLGFIFDENLTFSDQITSLSTACYYHIRQLCCIRPYLNLSTACTIVTSIVHSKLDYCNSLYYKLPKSSLPRLQQIQNSLARTVVKAPKSCHITPVLRSFHWLRITERIQYKLLSLIYKVLTTT